MLEKFAHFEHYILNNVERVFLLVLLVFFHDTFCAS